MAAEVTHAKWKTQKKAKRTKKQTVNHCTNHLKLARNEYQNFYRESIKVGDVVFYPFCQHTKVERT